jgi:hypothetical protein
MASMSMALPVKPGQREALKAFCKATVGEKLAEFEKSEKRIGLTREGWYLNQTPMGISPSCG